ncbi:hypothetical protein NW768_002609 [Fusarium equiseti]|uniref:Uncharacterized protein n=1 Tax=Fusarium equiseti TaxID=61235 RepID=A0ABQ8RPB3_FUSEQ|nr:hypothetical protein NW768_002609 [Fusarium equiseti]
MSQDQKDYSPYDLTNNSFKIGWRSTVNGTCNSTSVKTLDCFTTLVTYSLYIKNSRNTSQLIIADIDNEREFWGDTAWIQDMYHSYYLDGNVLVDDSVSVNFSNAQAFAISRGAVYALYGLVESSE